MGLAQQLGGEFRGDFDEFDEFGGVFAVCLLHLEMRLMRFLLFFGGMSLGVGVEQELGDEFDGDFDEFDEFGGAFAVCLLHLEMRFMSLFFFLGGVDEFGRGFGTGAWR